MYMYVCGFVRVSTNMRVLYIMFAHMWLCTLLWMCAYMHTALQTRRTETSPNVLALLRKLATLDAGSLETSVMQIFVSITLGL